MKGIAKNLIGQRAGDERNHNSIRSGSAAVDASQRYLYARQNLKSAQVNLQGNSPNMGAQHGQLQP